ncbi:MAG: arsenate reductase ArsC [Oligoflexus sp.]
MKILFMCVANSARSQMAEGLARHEFGDKAEFYSAGSKPSHVNPFAIKVLQELGIDLSQHHSKLVEDIPEQNFDCVITLCAEEVCPLYLGQTKKLHWPFEDPAGLADEAASLAKFRQIRDQIKKNLQTDLPAILA